MIPETEPARSPSPLPPAAVVCRGLGRRLLHWRALWIIPLLLLAVVARWPGLAKPFHHDEWQTLLQFEDTALVETVLPTAWTAQFAWHGIRAADLPMARIPFMIVGLLAVVVAWGFGRIWKDWTAGFAMALVFALWPFKTYLDTMMRPYAGWMFFILLGVLLLEAHRTRQRVLYFVLGTLACFFSSQEHEVAILIMLFPVLYLVWELMRIPWQMRSTPAGWARWRPLAVAVFQVVVIGLTCLLALQMRLGNQRAYVLAEEMSQVVQRQVRGERPLGKAPAASESVANVIPLADSGDQSSIRPEQVLPPVDPSTEHIPSLGEWLFYSRVALQRTFFSPPSQWTGANLFWQAEKRDPWGSLIAGEYSVPDWMPRGGAVEIAIVIALGIGSLALLFRSVPLVIGCWVCILGNGLTVYLHSLKVPSLSDRYYSLAGVCGIVLVVGGLSVIFGVLRKPLVRLRPRLNAAFVIFFALLLGGVASLICLKQAQASSAYWDKYWADPDDWGVINFTVRNFPQGALIYGTGDNNLAWLRRWEFYKHRAAGGGYWSSPARIGLVDVWEERSLIGPRLLERLNPYSGFVFFAPETILNQQFPLRKHGSLFPEREIGRAGRWATAYRPMEHRLFIMRDQLVVPLMPRFALPTHTDDWASVSLALDQLDYRIDAYFETPGRYRVAVDVREIGDVTQVMVNGDVVEHRYERIGANNTKLGVGTEPRWLKPFLDPLDQEQFKPVYDADQHGASILPLCAVFDIETPDDPLDPKPLELRLQFRQPPGDTIPLVRIGREAEPMTRVCAEFSVGQLRTYMNDEGALCFGFPLQIESFSINTLKAVVFLSDTKTNSTELRWDFEFSIQQRDLQVGDIIWVGPMELPAGRFDKWLEVPLVLSFLPVEMAPRGQRVVEQRIPFESNPRLYRPLQQFLLCYMKFVQRNGNTDVDISSQPL